MAAINKEINKLQVIGVSEDKIAEGMLKSIKELLSQWTFPDDRAKMLGIDDKDEISIVDDSYKIGVDMATTAPSFSPATATIEGLEKLKDGMISKWAKSTPKTKESFFEREYLCVPPPGPKEGERYDDPKTREEFIFIKGTWNPIKREEPKYYSKPYKIMKL